MDLYKISEQKMKYFNYSDNTIKIYLHYIDEFIRSVNKHHSRIISNDFSEYLINYKFTSISKQNQVINAIKFLYKKVLNKKYDKIDFTRPRGEKKLPKVIDNDFIISNLSKISNLKHKTILSLTYSVGLRVSEVINLKIVDIDSKRMIVNIINAKGKKIESFHYQKVCLTY